MRLRDAQGQARYSGTLEAFTMSANLVHSALGCTAALLASACNGSASSSGSTTTDAGAMDASLVAPDPASGGDATPSASDAPTSTVDGARSADSAPDLDAGPDAVRSLDAAPDATEAGVSDCDLPGQLAPLPWGVQALAVDEAGVYWAENFDGGSQLRKCAVGGCKCQPTTLVTTPHPALGGLALGSGLTVGSGKVYFVSSDGTGFPVIESCPVGGCALPTAVTGSLNSNVPDEMQVDSDNVYWAVSNLGSTTIFQCPVTGCGQGTVFAQGPIGTFAIDATNVYWTGAGPAEDGGYRPGVLFSCPKSGCTTPTTLTQGPAVNPLNVPTQGWSGPVAVDSTNLYWVTAGTYAGGAGTGNGSLMACALGGCTAPTVLATGLPLPGAIAADGSHVYWSGRYVDVVERCDLGSCAQQVAVAPGGSAGITTNFVVDATSVYWGTGNGALMKAPK